jgi:hypothetical protein
MVLQQNRFLDKVTNIQSHPEPWLKLVPDWFEVTPTRQKGANVVGEIFTDFSRPPASNLPNCSDHAA